MEARYFAAPVGNTSLVPFLREAESVALKETGWLPVPPATTGRLYTIGYSATVIRSFFGVVCELREGKNAKPTGSITRKERKKIIQ